MRFDWLETMQQRQRATVFEGRYASDQGFEAVMVASRQKLIVELIDRLRPTVVIEVGCGLDMLRRAVAKAGPDIARWIIVEPCVAFVEEAGKTLADIAGVEIKQGFFEAVAAEINPDGGADLIVMSGLLHEVPDPLSLLAAARGVLAPAGILHVNVPHTLSLHRRIGRVMGLIADESEPSDRNKHFLHYSSGFDRGSLTELVGRAGLKVVDEGGYLVKPFTHEQMAAIASVIAPEVIDGLWQIGRELPEIASEIFVNAGLP